jgi:hypothetical protein
MRLADRLGGTWTLLAQVLTAASPPTRLTGTASHKATPGADRVGSPRPLQDAEADSGTLLVLYP